MGTDEEKLIRYLKESGHDDWTVDESVRLHLKSYNMERYSQMDIAMQMEE